MNLTIVIPTYNEEKILDATIQKVYNFLDENMVNYKWQIIVADNGSTDLTIKIIEGVHKKNPHKIKYIHLPQKGRGRALKEAWKNFPADYYIYMDADLSTDLKHLKEMIFFLNTGDDIVVGSRLLKNSQTDRSWKREITSRFFNWLLKKILFLKTQDSQCGFKGINQKTFAEIIPLVNDNNWFFDTELLFWAQKNNFKIKEIPVEWTEGERKSKVKVIKTSLNYLKNIWRLRQYV